MIDCADIIVECCRAIDGNSFIHGNRVIEGNNVIEYRGDVEGYSPAKFLKRFA